MPLILVVSSICLQLMIESHPSMLWMLWIQRNVRLCISAATFKMIVMRSAPSAYTLSAVKPTQTRVTAAALNPNPNLDP